MKVLKTLAVEALLVIAACAFAIPIGIAATSGLSACAEIFRNLFLGVAP